MVLAVHASQGSEFATAGIVLVILRLNIGISRSWSAEASLTYAGEITRPGEEIGRSARIAGPCALSLSLIGLILLYAGNTLSIEVALLLVTAGVSMSVGEAARSTALLCQRVGTALWYDSVWLIVSASLYFVLSPRTPIAILMLWNIGSMAALVVFGRYLVQRCDSPGPSMRQRLGIAADAVADRGASQVATLVLAFGLRPELSAGFTAARNLLGPLNPIALSLFNLTFPRSRRSDAIGRGRLLVRNLVVIFVAVTALCLVLMALPTALMTSAVGETWSTAAQFLIPVSLSYMGMLFVQTSSAVGRGAGLGQEVRRSRFLAALLGLVPSTLIFTSLLPGMAVVFVASAIALAGSIQFALIVLRKVTLKGSTDK
ncbi:hypothetical protein ABQE93_10325 [Mycolicibacterium sp. XJ662]